MGWLADQTSVDYPLDDAYTEYAWLVPGTGVTEQWYGTMAVRLEASIVYDIAGTGDYRDRTMYPKPLEHQDERFEHFGDDDDGRIEWEIEHGFWEALISQVTLSLMDMEQSGPDYWGSEWTPEKRLTEVQDFLELLQSPAMAGRWV